MSTPGFEPETSRARRLAPIGWGRSGTRTRGDHDHRRRRHSGMSPRSGRTSPSRRPVREQKNKKEKKRKTPLSRRRPKKGQVLLKSIPSPFRSHCSIFIRSHRISIAIVYALVQLLNPNTVSEKWPCFGDEGLLRFQSVSLHQNGEQLHRYSNPASRTRIGSFSTALDSFNNTRHHTLSQPVTDSSPPDPPDFTTLNHNVQGCRQEE